MRILLQRLQPHPSTGGEIPLLLVLFVLLLSGIVVLKASASVEVKANRIKREAWNALQ